MMKSVTDESQERPNTASEELSREFIMERIRDVGEGSPFVYDTVVTPITDDALMSMKAYSDESFGNLSRVFDGLCGHDTGALPLDRTRMHHSMTPLREELEDIVCLESEILSDAGKALDSGCTNDADRYIIASAMRTIMRINDRIGTIISNIHKDGEWIHRGSSILHEHCSELKEHRNHVKGVRTVSVRTP